MTLRAAQADECFRQRERLPFAKEPVEREARRRLYLAYGKSALCPAGHLFAPEGAALRTNPLVYPYREEEIDHD